RMRTHVPGRVGAHSDAGIDLPAAELFAIVWVALAEVLGTAAMAAIVRRAAGRAAADCPELEEVVIVRDDLEYRYSLPREWGHKADRAPLGLRVLVREIGRLLVELTGTIVIRQLEAIPALRAAGLAWRAEVAN